MILKDSMGDLVHKHEIPVYCLSYSLLQAFVACMGTLAKD